MSNANYKNVKYILCSANQIVKFLEHFKVRKNTVFYLIEKKKNGWDRKPGYRPRSAKYFEAFYVGMAHASNLRHASEARAPYVRR